MPSAPLQSYLDDLGLAHEPQLVRDRVALTADFMENRMGWNYDDTLKYMKGIDFNGEVKIEKFKPGDHVITYAKIGQPAGAERWFAPVGTGCQDLGIDSSNREFRRYRVKQEMECLSSRAQSINVSWNVQPGPNNPIRQHKGHTLGGYPNKGGGKQFLVPEADKNLERAPLMGEHKPALRDTQKQRKKRLVH